MNQKLNKILGICCTHGRVSKLARAVRCFLDFQYEELSMMLICNSGNPLYFKDMEGKLDIVYTQGLYKYIYIYNIKDTDYNSVGEKYNLALKKALEIFPDVDVVYSEDDDDLYLPTHLSEGNKGFNQAKEQGQLAYKPIFSYFRYLDANKNIGIIANGNSYEPSIFVDKDYLVKTGYAPVSIKYHQQWLDPLIIDKKIFVDPQGKPTLIYNWGDGDIYKMSGSGVDNPANLLAHKRNSLDMGNGVLTPTESNQKYYDEVKKAGFQIK